MQLTASKRVVHVLRDCRPRFWFHGSSTSYPDLQFTISLQYDGVDGPYSEIVALSLKPTDEALHLTDHEIGKELHEIRETLERIRSKLET